MIALLSLTTVLAWGTWIPLAQAVRGVPQRTRTFYVTIGNLMLAGAVLTAAGVLWGSYFVPAQWAGVSAQTGDFPLAIGILAGGLALVLSGGERVTAPAKGIATLVAAGILFGIGNLALLSLVSRVGTGVGFTIAQLSLLVNASIGIWVFRVPLPGSREARLTMAGILIAGFGGAVIGAMR